MKKSFLFLMVILSLNAFSATFDTLQTTSEIKDVTVFLNGAQISRSISLNTKKGKHAIMIGDLPGELNPQSIQVEKVENCKILSVKHQLSYPNEAIKSKIETEIKNKIEVLDLKSVEIQNKFGVFGLEEKLLLDNSRFQNKEGGASVSEIKEAADFYRQRLNEIRSGKVKLSKELEETNKEIQDLYVQLNKEKSNKGKEYSQIWITIDCEKDLNTNLKVSYYISSAGWVPTYDFRVEDITEPLSIVYNANVYQSSGENWKNVNLTLSTNNPSLSGNKPELVTWYLDRGNPYKKEIKAKGPGTYKGRVYDSETNEALPFANIILFQNNKAITGGTTDSEGMFTIKPIPSGYYDIEISYIGYQKHSIKTMLFSPNKTIFQDVKLKPSTVMLEQVAVMSYKSPLLDKDMSASTVRLTRNEISMLPGVVTGGTPTQFGDRRSYNEQNQQLKSTNYISNSLKTTITSLEYEIEIPYTVLSDGEDYAIRIKEVSLPVNYLYHAVPKLDDDVFLTAEIMDWANLNLLSGKTNIYYQGTYTGESFIDVNQAKDTLSVSLGRDRNIIIKRDINKQLFDKKAIGNNIKETLAYEILVKNNKNTKIKLIIEDQHPISDKKSIEIENIDFGNAQHDKDTGILKWELEVDAFQKQSVRYSYTAKYPKYINSNIN